MLLDSAIITPNSTTLSGLQDLHLPLLVHEDPLVLELPPLLLPLTENNLCAHTLQTNLGEQPIIMTNTPTTTTGGRRIIDDLREFRFFRVVVDSEQTLPPALRAYVLSIRDAKRQDSGSPSVQNIMDNAKILRRIRTEPTVISLLCPNLMFRSAMLPDGEKFTWWEQETRLNIDYVTKVHNGSKFALTTPIPDACNGYIRREIADLSRLRPACPFTEEEEAKLLDTPGLPPILTDALVSFLTGQFKTSTGQSLEVAQLQSARDGVAICEYLHRLFTRSSMAFSEVHTCHWSVTCDAVIVNLFLHWREQTNSGPRYHMMDIATANLRANAMSGDNPDLRRMRDRLRNIQRYAVEERLQGIKQALSNIPLPLMTPKKTRGKGSSWPPSDKVLESAVSSPRDNQPMPPPQSNNPFQDAPYPIFSNTSLERRDQSRSPRSPLADRNHDCPRQTRRAPVLMPEMVSGSPLRCLKRLTKDNSRYPPGDWL